MPKIKVIQNFEFTEGIGGGGAVQYLLNLNGGICRGYSKENFSYGEALEDAQRVVDETKRYYGPTGKHKVKFVIQPDKKLLPTSFSFWKGNRLDSKFTLTVKEVKAKFMEWLKTREVSWLEYYDTYNVVCCFVGDKEEKKGLDSVMFMKGKNNDYMELSICLKQTKNDYLSSLKS